VSVATSAASLCRSSSGGGGTSASPISAQVYQLLQNALPGQRRAVDSHARRLEGRDDALQAQQAPITLGLGICHLHIAVGGRGGAPPIAAAGAGFGRANLDRAAATRAGFVDSQETTHGLSMAELRAKLSEAGVGVRMASTSADLW